MAKVCQGTTSGFSIERFDPVQLGRPSPPSLWVEPFLVRAVSRKQETAVRAGTYAPVVEGGLDQAIRRKVNGHRVERGAA